MHDLTTFRLVAAMPAEAMTALPFAVVNSNDLEGATWGGVYGAQCAARLALAGIDNADDWEILGSRHEDNSGYDDFEGKWEYDSTVYVALARRSDVRAAFVAWSMACATPLTYRLGDVWAVAA